MNLKELRIVREEYGQDKGKLLGKIKVDSQDGEITIRLTPKHIEQILRVCADSLVEVSKEVASELTSSMIEQSAVPLIES